LSAVPAGIHYTYTWTSTELFDYSLLFDPAPGVADARQAKLLNLKVGERLLAFPRASFDLWNARYFVIPGRLFPGDMQRDGSSFLADTERLYPTRDFFRDSRPTESRQVWLDREDVQLLRNNNAFPRAWIVHRARFMKPIVDMNPNTRRPLLNRITGRADGASTRPSSGDADPHELTWVETERPEALRPFVRGGKSRSIESVDFDQIEPCRVELTAHLGEPGLVVLADVFYPGWRLTVDGKATEILRVNRMMRGAAVDAGTHRLVYTYQPLSFRVGMVISLCALAVTVVLIAASLLHPRAGQQ
jgi:hypothetical protein